MKKMKKSDFLGHNIISNLTIIEVAMYNVSCMYRVCNS